MKVSIIQTAIVVAGLSLIVLGFWGSRQESSAVMNIVSWGAPVGLAVSLIGLLMILTPGFFN